MDDQVVPYSWEYKCESNTCPHVFEENGIVYIEDTARPNRYVSFPVDEWVAYVAHVRAAKP
jgi:hypothetical protein